jgi:hypothetical protein
MCVLIVLDRMDRERLSLLQEDMAGGKDKEYLIMGMELLQNASQSSNLAARYLIIFQQLSGGDVRLRSANALQRSDATEYNISDGLAHLQNGELPFDIDSLDPLWGTNYDFVGFDDLLNGAELWGGFSTGATAS